MNNQYGWRYRLTNNQWFASWADTDNRIDVQFGMSFGPFESKDAAREHVSNTSKQYDCAAE